MADSTPEDKGDVFGKQSHNLLQSSLDLVDNRSHIQCLKVKCCLLIISLFTSTLKKLHSFWSISDIKSLTSFYFLYFSPSIRNLKALLLVFIFPGIWKSKAYYP